MLSVFSSLFEGFRDASAYQLTALFLTTAIATFSNVYRLKALLIPKFNRQVVFASLISFYTLGNFLEFAYTLGLFGKGQTVQLTITVCFVISNYAFIACPSLTSLKIPESVIVFGENFGSCFRDCPNLHELYYSSKNATVYGIPGSVTTLSIGEKVEVLPRWFIPNDSLIETLTIPENIRIVRNECIMGGPKLREITILSKDIVLEDGWTNCPNLKKISVRADMYETLLPQLPQKDGLKIEKIYPHHFLFFKW